MEELFYFFIGRFGSPEGQILAALFYIVLASAAVAGGVYIFEKIFGPL